MSRTQRRPVLVYLTAVLLLTSGGSMAAAAGTWLRAARARLAPIAAPAAGGTTAEPVAAGLVLVVALAGSLVLTALTGTATALVAFAVVGTATAVLAAASRHLHPLGRISRALAALHRLAFAAWWVGFLATADLGPAATVVAVGWVLVSWFVLPWQVIDDYLFAEVLCRDRWTQPRRAAAAHSGFRISVHVPCYSEPPDVVCRTLDALAAQRYADFEVLVVDNNTTDERLWRPVAEHCAGLGPRFRFFHVDPLAGAKAGALNVALGHTADGTDLVAVLDCDYVAEPAFLARLAGFFTDERIGFVQTAHDYRDLGDNRYLAGCYGEYRVPYASYLVSRNEWAAPLIVGTMCVIRRAALDRVGGWSSTCVTEDSELAIRLHAAGYAGRYLPTTFGRGLIPDTFAAYRRQRSRWIGGPVQELRRHWRSYLPRRWARPSALTGIQKLLFAHHGLREVSTGLRTVLAAVVAVGALVATATGTPTVDLPAAAAAALLLGAAPPLVVRWALQRHAVGSGVRDAAGALMAYAALTYVGRVAGLRSLLGIRRPWGRTGKFPAPVRPSALRRWAAALRSARAELAAGTAWATVACVVAVAWPGSVFTTLVVLYLLHHAAVCLAAPAVALLAEGQRRDRRRDHSGDHSGDRRGDHGGDRPSGPARPPRARQATGAGSAAR